MGDNWILFCISCCNTNLHYPRNRAKSYQFGMVKISELFNLKLPPANYAIMDIMLYFTVNIWQYRGCIMDRPILFHRKTICSTNNPQPPNHSPSNLTNLIIHISHSTINISTKFSTILAYCLTPLHELQNIHPDNFQKFYKLSNKIHKLFTNNQKKLMNCLQFVNDLFIILWYNIAIIMGQQVTIIVQLISNLV